MTTSRLEHGEPDRDWGAGAPGVSVPDPKRRRTVGDWVAAARGHRFRAAGRRRAGSVLSRLTSSPGVVSTRLAERLSERRAARRRLVVRRGVVVGAAAALVALLAYLVFYSPVLALRSDRVRVVASAATVDPGLVVAEVAGAAGTPLVRLSMAELAAAVEMVAGVRSASVSRAWPNGVAVDVVARVPVAAVARDGQYALLDVDAVQVGDLVASAPDGVPVVAVPAGEGSADALTAVLGVLDALPAELLAEIREAGAATADTVRFRLRDGSRVEWGGAELSALKVRVLEVLRQRPASVYDVSAPTMPVTR